MRTRRLEAVVVGLSLFLLYAHAAQEGEDGGEEGAEIDLEHRALVDDDHQTDEHEAAGHLDELPPSQGVVGKG